jgi:hypothetical protein
VTDLGLVLGGAESVVDAVIDTSGCTVGLRRPHDPAGDPVDPATLAVTDSTRAKYATGVAALVVPASSTSDGQPARPAGAQTVRVIVKDEDAGAQVLARDEVVVETARDAALVGQEYAVTLVQRSSVGVVAVLHCAPVRRP